LSFSLSSGRSRDYFYLSAVVKLSFAPDPAPDHLAVDRNGNTSWFDLVSNEKILHRFVDVRLIDSVHPNHVNRFANSSAPRELRGANVTPWR
jgi:hypothetical protein